MWKNFADTKVWEEWKGGGAPGPIMSIYTADPMVEQVFLCNLWRGPHQSRYPDCSTLRTPCWSRWLFPEGLQAMEENHTKTWERCAEEGAAQRNWYGLNTTCHSPSPGTNQPGGEEVEEMRMKEGSWAWIGRQAEREHVLIVFCLCFLQPKSILAGNKIH